MYKSNGFIDIRVVNSRDECCFGLFNQMFLDGTDATHIFDVFVEARVNGHVFGSDSEALFVFVLISDADHEGDARWILFHHVKHEPHCKVHTLNH